VARYQSIIAYDGTEFSGFQRQAAGTLTVQAAIEASLRAIGWQGESLLAAGRTDAGVHARGQVVAYDLDWAHSAEALTAALNANLPDSIGVKGTQAAGDDFHPRFQARSRCYQYRLLLAPTRDPLAERYAWRRWPGPDLKPMRAVATALIGRHDFRAFGPAPIEGGHTLRMVFRAEWRSGGGRLTFEIAADAFLQHMVRRIVAASVAAGEGRARVDEIVGLIDAPQARWQGVLAPARGLTLQAVTYDNRGSQEDLGADPAASDGVTE